MIKPQSPSSIGIIIKYLIKQLNTYAHEPIVLQITHIINITDMLKQKILMLIFNSPYAVIINYNHFKESK